MESSNDFDKDNYKGDSIWDLQAGHGTRIAGLIYARLLSEGRFETKSQCERFHQVNLTSIVGNILREPWPWFSFCRGHGSGF